MTAQYPYSQDQLYSIPGTNIGTNNTPHHHHHHPKLIGKICVHFHPKPQNHNDPISLTSFYRKMPNYNPIRIIFISIGILTQLKSIQSNLTIRDACFVYFSLRLCFFICCSFLYYMSAADAQSKSGHRNQAALI